MRYKLSEKLAACYVSPSKGESVRVSESESVRVSLSLARAKSVRLEIANSESTNKLVN